RVVADLTAAPHEVNLLHDLVWDIAEHPTRILQLETGTYRVDTAPRCVGLIPRTLSFITRHRARSTDDRIAGAFGVDPAARPESSIAVLASPARGRSRETKVPAVGDSPTMRLTKVARHDAVDERKVAAIGDPSPVADPGVAGNEATGDGQLTPIQDPSAPRVVGAIVQDLCLVDLHRSGVTDPAAPVQRQATVVRDGRVADLHMPTVDKRPGILTVVFFERHSLEVGRPDVDQTTRSCFHVVVPNLKVRQP